MCAWFLQPEALHSCADLVSLSLVLPLCLCCCSMNYVVADKRLPIKL